MSDGDRDLASTTDLDAALAQAKPMPRNDSQQVRDSVAKLDSDSADPGLGDQRSDPARGSTLAEGWTPEVDPHPANPAGTRGIEGGEHTVRTANGRGIPGAYSGDPEELRDEHSNRNESKA